MIFLGPACRDVQPAPTTIPEYRFYVPLAEVGPFQTPGPKRIDVRILNVLQNGPQNQILALINHGNGPAVIGGWWIEIEGAGEIYRFSGGIIPPYEGKLWLSTSRESRLSAFTLGYFPEDSGARYRLGAAILLRNVEGRVVDRYEVREIVELPSP